MQTYTLTIEKFDREYRPLLNPFDDNASWDGCMLETYGEELDHVKTVLQHAPLRVWTIVEDDYGNPVLTNGFHYVNRIGYVVTVNPAPEDVFINVVD